MPRYLKIVIGILVIEIILSILSLPSIKSILWISINLGILSGFRSRSKIALHFARVVRLVGLAGYASFAVIYIQCFLSVPQFRNSFNGILGILSFGMLVQLFVFIALGKASVKKYFGVSGSYSQRNEYKSLKTDTSTV